MVQIRRAEARDWVDILPLLTVLRREDGSRSNVVGELSSRFDHHLDREDAAAFVAELNRLVVGFADVEFRSRLTDVRPYAKLRNLVVAADAQGRGIGRALVEAVERAARDRQCVFVTVESGNDRLEAQALYRGLGYDQDAVSFTKRLDERSTG